MISEKNIFKIIENYFEDNKLTNIQINSYNNLINNTLQRIIEEESTIEVIIKKNKKYIVHFNDILIENPYVLEEDRTTRYIVPAEARLRDLTYESAILVNIETLLIEKEYGYTTISKN